MPFYEWEGCRRNLVYVLSFFVSNMFVYCNTGDLLVCWAGKVINGGLCVTRVLITASQEGNTTFLPNTK